jgi:hypothetical protein
MIMKKFDELYQTFCEADASIDSKAQPLQDGDWVWYSKGDLGMGRKGPKNGGRYQVKAKKDYLVLVPDRVASPIQDRTPVRLTDKIRGYITKEK